MFKFKLSYVALAAAMTSTFVYADPSTYTHISGTPIVDIDAPNEAGVSHNMYREFNVSNKGVILNNSDSNYTHDTLGNIAKNNNLTNGGASVILNEVISNKASSLQGFIEVGGKKADVVIANPNGITCSGCSFINTNRAVLTTGAVSFSYTGAISSYNVTGGKITIDKNGMDATNNLAIILADAININGIVTANNAILGAGHATFDNTTGQFASAGKSATLMQVLYPEYSIDITNLGGISANSINMVGNNLGFGVRNKGAVVANYSLSLASNGTLVNEGNITNNGILTQMASAGELKNTGTISNANVATFTSYKNLSNTGTITSQNQMAVSAKENILNNGTIKAGNKLVVGTDGNLENNGAAYLQSGDQLIVSALGDITQNGGLMQGLNTAITFGGKTLKTTGYIIGDESLLIQSAKDNLLSSGEIINTGGIFGGDIYVQTKGTLTQAANSEMKATSSLVALSNYLNNTGYMGGIYADVMVQNAQTDNQGHIDGASVSVVTSGKLYNQGLIRSGSDMILNTQNQGNIVNRGQIIAKDTMTLTAKQIENGGYGCGFLKLSKCGVGNIAANTLKLNSSHTTLSSVGGTQSFKTAEITTVK